MGLLVIGQSADPFGFVVESQSLTKSDYNNGAAQYNTGYTYHPIKVIS